MRFLHALFRQAPDLGSLIDPHSLGELGLFKVDFAELREAVRAALVTPQNWLFPGSYKWLREHLRGPHPKSRYSRRRRDPCSAAADHPGCSGEGHGRRTGDHGHRAGAPARLDHRRRPAGESAGAWWPRGGACRAGSARGMTGKYRTAAAFRTALEAHIAAHARRATVLVVRVRKAAMFERLLARLQTVAPDRWLLKDALALDFRFGTRARATNDMDLARIDDVETATAELMAAAAYDAGDNFRFVVQQTNRLDALETAAARQRAATAFRLGAWVSQARGRCWARSRCSTGTSSRRFLPRSRPGGRVLRGTMGQRVATPVHAG